MVFFEENFGFVVCRFFVRYYFLKFLFFFSSVFVGEQDIYIWVCEEYVSFQLFLRNVVDVVRMF